MAVLLTLAKVADEKPAIQSIPWGVIVMVCGVTVLTPCSRKPAALICLLQFWPIRDASDDTGLIALVTGLASVYSSTSGVVFPALLPSVPGLVAKLGGGNPLAIASSILIGGHLVDVSPLSTIGALLHRRRRRPRPIAVPLQPSARLGPVDVGCRGNRVLPGVWKMVE